MKNDVDLDGGLLVVVAHGEQDRAEAEETVARSLALLGEADLPCAPLCIDLADQTGATPEARRVYAEALKTEAYTRIAFAGGSMLMRTLSNLVMRASGRAGRARFFADRDAAVRWLAAWREGSSRGHVQHHPA
jgi:hypothetical protein